MRVWDRSLWMAAINREGEVAVLVEDAAAHTFRKHDTARGIGLMLLELS